MKPVVLFILGFSMQTLVSVADEGMWIPSLLEHYNIDIMLDKGLELTAEEIYSINSASIKDAVVIFSRGCTGVIVSEEGLLFTNHHCGYSSIQSLSSIENDYLKNGYWAMNREEEIPAPDLSVTFLIGIEDVSSAVLAGTGTEITEAQRKDKIDQNIRKITEEAIRGNHYKALIKPFFYGNEYYMFIYEEYSDIRLVGTPPSSIGNFGSDPDNWVWPRHSGDFIVFRVYAGHDNRPSAYSPENVPLQPRVFLPISTEGLNDGDFTMVMGYPGTTTEYLVSPAVGMIYKSSLPHKIRLREKRMEILSKYMKESDLVNLQYAAKYKSVSNAWKKWLGMVRGLERIDAIGVKQLREREFMIWAESDENRKKQYGKILPDLFTLYKELDKFSLAYDYYHECFMATEIFTVFMNMGGMITRTRGKNDEDKILAKDLFMTQAELFFKNYYRVVDEEIFATMLRYYYEEIDESFHPEIYTEIQRKYKGNYEQYAKVNFRKSNLVSLEGIISLLANYPDNENSVVFDILNDPLYKIFAVFSRVFDEEVFARYEFLSDEIERNYRLYMKALMEKDSDRVFYPDANFTMRLSYGKAEGYQPSDAVVYHYHTTLSGKMDKFITGSEDYDIPAKLRNLHEARDYGRWADASGELNICFISSNHTSGGNSGSPVMNSYGHLVGLNFDRNWEGTMSDIMYDPSQCRNISVDIRYVLFIIDKFAGAGYLIDEMVLVE